jgi:hypothetical protein
MAKSLGEVMSTKSDEGLIAYINNFEKYTPDALTAATNELKRRGKKISEEELKEIHLKIQARVKAESEEETLWPSESLRKEIVTDLNAPLLYSKATVRAFSIVFTVIFGAVLLSNNISDSKKKWIVIAFGITYTTLSIILLNIIPPSTVWVLLLNAAGGLGLTTTFWDKYIGKDVKYRAKPIWIPLIISIIISIPFILAMIYLQ